MQKEYETQVIGIDAEEIACRLRELGAEEFPEVIQKRWVFDIMCLGAEKAGVGEWVRLREVNGKTTMTYKNRKDTGISDTEEIEFEVENFEKAAQLLSKLKWTGEYYQENKRVKFVLNGIEFTLDTWPRIPVFLEIESSSEEKVKEGLRMLGLQGKDAGHIGLLQIYQRYGINIHDYKELKFG